MFTIHHVSHEGKVIAMYLVRTIQRTERPEWVDQLGRDPEFSLPLPIVPRRDFTQVIVIHGERALGFDRDRVEVVDTPEDAPVGTRDEPVIQARSYVYVRRGPKRIGRAKVRGFTGIRYIEHWSDVAD
jgi:hypothetical protein